jgi:transposase
VKLLRQIPCIGPIRAGLLLALIQTPHRFRSKQQLWTYSGLGVATHDSAQHRYVDGQLQRSRKPSFSLSCSFRTFLRSSSANGTGSRRIQAGPERRSRHHNFHKRLAANSFLKRLHVLPHLRIMDLSGVHSPEERPTCQVRSENCAYCGSQSMPSTS